ncbi:MAG TPA: NAD(P)/FAD-dependent oxidoreductase [Pseudolabrys sp.]|nr:NAD(P)/FAD-dependent oxidoreductase [Pseudolabrys sp.]
MSGVTRRRFLASAAAAAATPALGAVPSSGDVDVIIIGAGAAGIAAARRVAQAGRRFALIEAADRIGGRCITDARSFGVPFDRGARFIYLPESNPVAQLAPRTGLEIYPAARGQKPRVGRRNARDGEIETFLAARFRARRAIVEAGRGKADVAAERALPKDLLDWQPTIEFVLGPYGCGKDLREVSAADIARATERDSAAFCRQGFGALLAKLGEGVPVQLNTAATRIEWLKSLEVETTRGRLRARAVIVTASPSVLAAGKIAFTPELPERQRDALNRLKLGTYEHIAVELPGNPLGLGKDELVFEKTDGAHTAALIANIGGTSLCTVDVAGGFGRELTQQGPDAMAAFAGDWLASLFGEQIKSAIRRTQVTQWNSAPWTLGAFAAASPGDDAHKVLMDPIRERVWFAGDAAHETLWGTVGGAWESGVRAAEAALRKMGALKDTEPQASAPPPRHRRRRRELEQPE